MQEDFGFGRCHALETTVEDALEALNIDTSVLDKAWRDFADCGKSWPLKVDRLVYRRYVL